MTFFTRRKIKIIGLIVAIILLALGIIYLFSKGAKQEKTFTNNESTLEVQSQTSPVQRLISEPNKINGKLSVDSQPDGIQVDMIKVSAEDPLFLDTNSLENYTTPFSLEELETGKYWLHAQQDNYYDFVEVFDVASGKSNELQIVLEEMPLEERGINIEGSSEVEALIKQTEQYYEDNPLMYHLPHKTENFEVHVADENDVYLIELFPGASKVLEYSEYLYELSLYKNEARDWIKSKDIDPDSIRIQWLPEK